MPARSRLPVRCASLGLIIMLAGCATARPRDATKDPPVGQLITAEQIRETGASTAWQALKFTVRTHQFTDARGEPVRIFSNRGVGSFVLREEPLVFVDGARLIDIQLLQQMPAHHIHSVRVLNGTDGTTYYGTSAVAGVFLIETTMGADLAPDDTVPPDTGTIRSYQH
jgi:hypothetical protein